MRKLLLLSLLASSLPLDAQELIVNGSFGNTAGTFVPDANQVMSLAPGSGTIPGWSVINASLLWGPNTNEFGPATPFGTFSIDLTGYQDSLAFGGVRQIIATTPGQDYRLSLALGAYQSNPLFSGPMSVSIAAGGVTDSFTFHASGEGSQWSIFTRDFTASGASTTISITGTGSGGGAYLGLDNVSVIALTPKLSIAATVPGTVTLSWTPNTPGFILQETLSLSPASWTNSPSGSTNPVTLPVVPPAKFFRLLKP